MRVLRKRVQRVYAEFSELSDESPPISVEAEMAELEALEERVILMEPMMLGKFIFILFKFKKKEKDEFYIKTIFNIKNERRA